MLGAASEAFNTDNETRSSTLSEVSEVAARISSFSVWEVAAELSVWKNVVVARKIYDRKHGFSVIFLIQTTSADKQ